MSITRSAITRAVVSLIENGARSSTVFVNERERITATRRFKHRRNARTDDIVLTIGRPNFAQRRCLAKYLKRGKIPRHAHLTFFRSAK